MLRRSVESTREVVGYPLTSLHSLGVSSQTWAVPGGRPFFAGLVAATLGRTLEPMPEEKSPESITFRGRGDASLVQGRIVLHVCPICSQRNALAVASSGRCAWCAYIPDPADVEPAQPGGSRRG